jgi:ubiquitin-protein ligase
MHSASGSQEVPPLNTEPHFTMTPRMRRLDSDYRQLTSAFASHRYIKLEFRGPLPPERYRIFFNVPGLRLDDQNRVCKVYQHVIDIYLPAGYPRDKPYATSLNPVFHPNFGAHVCIADFWSPGQSLVEVVVQIADMLQYRLYNIHSPLNAVAAAWVSTNQSSVPLSNIDTMPEEPTILLS